MKDLYEIFTIKIYKLNFYFLKLININNFK